MSKDVAQRELDQAGFRISNLGDPVNAGDATKTDNRSIPNPNAGTGAPGKSLLAAPADHTHPASEVAAGGLLLTLNDQSQQSTNGTTDEVVAEFLVNFGELDEP